jgi:hypothetical protein
MNVVLLRVGIDTGAGGILSPLFPDGSFEFVPIPDGWGGPGVDGRTYGNTVGRHGRPLVEYFPPRRQPRMRDQPMHVDPEWETFTYGDPTRLKGRLRELTPGDLLVFYAGLQGWGWEQPPALYIVGYFEVECAGMASRPDDRTLAARFGANYHVRHPQVLADQRSRLALVAGGAGSRLLRRAARISVIGLDKRGGPTAVLSPEAQAHFGDFGGKTGIKMSSPRWVWPEHVERAAAFVRALD